MGLGAREDGSLYRGVWPDPLWWRAVTSCRNVLSVIRCNAVGSWLTLQDQRGQKSMSFWNVSFRNFKCSSLDMSRGLVYRWPFPSREGKGYMCYHLESPRQTDTMGVFQAIIWDPVCVWFLSYFQSISIYQAPIRGLHLKFWSFFDPAELSLGSPFPSWMSALPSHFARSLLPRRESLPRVTAESRMTCTLSSSFRPSPWLRLS